MRDESNRTAILYALIQEYISDGMSFLDLGCGFCGFPGMQGTSLIESIKEGFQDIEYCGMDKRADVIEKCKETYPDSEWLCIDANDFEPTKKYDFVIHIGFDRWWSPLWKVHLKLFGKDFNPSVVLLESGSPTWKDSEHMEVYYRVRSIYSENGYTNPQRGSYIWTLPVSQPQRYFSIHIKEAKA